MNTEYNGWTNYQTWNVKLWIDNDQGMQEMVLDVAREVELPELSEQLQEMIEADSPLLLSASMYADLLNHALRNVDWYQIAKSFKDQIEEGY